MKHFTLLPPAGVRGSVLTTISNNRPLDTVGLFSLADVLKGKLHLLLRPETYIQNGNAVA